MSVFLFDFDLFDITHIIHFWKFHCIPMEGWVWKNNNIIMKNSFDLTEPLKGLPRKITARTALLVKQ